MNKAPKAERKALREAIGYDADPPRCKLCKDYALAVLTRTGPAMPFCDKFLMVTSPNAICDHWQGRDGATLEGVEIQTFKAFTNEAREAAQRDGAISRTVHKSQGRCWEMADESIDPGAEP